MHTAEYLTPVLTTSKFQEKGMLTPEEFVAAGDQLVFKCQTWQWASGDSSMAKKYLPPDKQFLITRNVPSLCRASTYAMQDAQESMVEGDGEDGWLSTHVDTDFQKNLGMPDIVDMADVDDVPSVQMKSLHIDNTYMQNNTDDIPDIDAAAFGVEEDDAAALGAPQPHTTYLTASEPEDNVVQTRTYDLSITYDKFYRTPRMYLFGYDERRQPLTSDKVMEDISADHANKTVTVDPHPHTGIPCASIHPCKHSSMMKRMIDYHASETATSGENSSVTVGQYMFLFLKFMAAVIPTIDYDYTIST